MYNNVRLWRPLYHYVTNLGLSAPYPRILRWQKWLWHQSPHQCTLHLHDTASRRSLGATCSTVTATIVIVHEVKVIEHLGQADPRRALVVAAAVVGVHRQLRRVWKPNKAFFIKRQKTHTNKHKTKHECTATVELQNKCIDNLCKCWQMFCRFGLLLDPPRIPGTLCNITNNITDNVQCSFLARLHLIAINVHDTDKIRRYNEYAKK